MAFTKRQKKEMQEQFAKYRKAYGNLTDQECMELYDYDKNHTDSDEMAKEWLENEMTAEMIEKKELEEKFYRTEKKEPVITKAQQKVNTANATKARQDRITILEEGLRAYRFLFGDLVEKTSTELVYKDSETGLPISIKISKHKVQKVVSKVIKRKPIKLKDGTEEDAPFTTVELRAMAIENIMMNNHELFEAVSFAGTQMGFACHDIKYPFGSIKMTHHKK